MEPLGQAPIGTATCRLPAGLLDDVAPGPRYSGDACTIDGQEVAMEPGGGRKKRVLRFAVSGALLVGIANPCASDEDPHEPTPNLPAEVHDTSEEPQRYAPNPGPQNPTPTPEGESDPLE